MPGAALVLAALDFAAAALMFVYFFIPFSLSSVSFLFLIVLLIVVLLLISVVSLVSGGVRSEPRFVRHLLLGGTIAAALAIVIPTLVLMMVS